MFKKLLLLSLLITQTAYGQVVHTLTKVISVVPAIETSVYASGDLVGEKLTLALAVDPGMFTGVIAQTEITDADAEAAPIDVVYFDSDPTGTTFTDNAAFDIADADLSKVICVISVTTYAAFNDNAIGLAQNANCPFNTPTTTTTIYAALVARGAVTYTAGTDLTLRTGIYQD